MSPIPTVNAGRGEAIAGRALDKQWMERVARAGILSRAVNYMVLAILVTAVLLGRSNKEVDRRGAVEGIAGAPLGRTLLVLLCMGFVAYIAWQLLRAVASRRDQGPAANTGRRALAVGTAVVYAAFLVTTVRVLVGSSTQSPQNDQDSLTARLLGASGGRLLVVLAGAAIIIVGLVLVGYAASRKFETLLDTSSMGRSMRRAAAVLGIAGQAARGLVFVIVGGFVLSAGISADAAQSKGLDASLKTLAAQRFGALMLSVVALGFLAFGLYSLIDARYRDDFTR
ncbi:MAG: DUF1206 domain-containing protein [Candidatus Dormibacteraeota bacterium]|uniref:DUF1206 domain-containing protein n=1 Tax=Candidatus Amunia macphersoniae TaxID=3127014 RepID=A0A934KK09_9BACT|nr:DUF1206 domain-containing protein [Candidatus Dormibacteraeota bacterium]